MRFYKNINGNYITAVGTGCGGTEITESEYNSILAVIRTKPSRTDTTDYHLTTDLTWEAFEREPEVPTDEIDAEEALDILIGGAT